MGPSRQGQVPGVYACRGLWYTRLSLSLLLANWRWAVLLLSILPASYNWDYDTLSQNMASSLWTAHLSYFVTEMGHRLTYIVRGEMPLLMIAYEEKYSFYCVDDFYNITVWQVLQVIGLGGLQSMARFSGDFWQLLGYDFAVHSSYPFQSEKEKVWPNNQNTESSYETPGYVRDRRPSWTWWFKPVISAFRRRAPEDPKLEPAWVTLPDSVS